jgi:hypothetical protein
MVGLWLVPVFDSTAAFRLRLAGRKTRFDALEDFVDRFVRYNFNAFALLLEEIDDGQRLLGICFEPFEDGVNVVI